MKLSTILAASASLLTLSLARPESKGQRSNDYWAMLDVQLKDGTIVQDRAMYIGLQGGEYLQTPSGESNASTGGITRSPSFSPMFQI